MTLTAEKMSTTLLIHGHLLSVGSQKLAEIIGYNEFMPSDELMTYVAETFCEPDEESQFICNDIMFLLGGYDPDQLNEVSSSSCVTTSCSCSEATTRSSWMRSVPVHV